MNSLAAKEKACAIRTDIIEMLHEAGSRHPGGSLSCTDILAALYFGGVMNHNPENPEDEARDRFILAKGHAAPAIYATLAEAGYFPVAELKRSASWVPACRVTPTLIFFLVSKFLPALLVRAFPLRLA